MTVAGYALQKLTSAETTTLSNVVLHILTPCLIFASIVNASFEGNEWLEVAVIAAATTFTLLLVSFVAARVMKLSNELSSTFVLSISFGNVGNYGFPLCFFSFGEKGLGFAVFFYLVSIVLMFTVGVLVASGSSSGLRQGLKSVVRLPIIYAICAAAAVKLSGVTLPMPIMQAANLTSQGTIPIMLILMGMELARSRVQWSRSERWGLISLSSGLKLVFPILFVGIIDQLIGLTGVAGKVTILQASMPTAVFVTLLTMKYGGDSRLATSTVLLSTIISIATLTALLSFMM